MSIPSTMRALQQTSLSGPQDLRLITDAPVPSPGPGELLIRVTAAGVNFVDISQARGTFAGGPQPPYLAGIEGAGEVTAVKDHAREVEVQALPGNRSFSFEVRGDDPDDGMADFAAGPEGKPLRPGSLIAWIWLIRHAQVGA